MTDKCTGTRIPLGKAAPRGRIRTVAGLVGRTYGVEAYPIDTEEGTWDAVVAVTGFDSEDSAGAVAQSMSNVLWQSILDGVAAKGEKP